MYVALRRPCTYSICKIILCRHITCIMHHHGLRFSAHVHVQILRIRMWLVKVVIITLWCTVQHSSTLTWAQTWQIPWRLLHECTIGQGMIRVTYSHVYHELKPWHIARPWMRWQWKSVAASRVRTIHHDCSWYYHKAYLMYSIHVCA